MNYMRDMCYCYATRSGTLRPALFIWRGHVAGKTCTIVIERRRGRGADAGKREAASTRVSPRFFISSEEGLEWITG